MKTHTDKMNMTRTLENLLSSHNLKFVHVRVMDTDDEPLRFGGLTIAYAPDNVKIGHNTNMVRISLAWCNPTEAFNKLAGRFYSTLNFESGNFVRFRILDPDNIERNLIDAFAQSTQHMSLAPQNQKGYKKPKVKHVHKAL